MTLQLNPLPKYKEFYGKATVQMHKLIAEGYVPLSVAGVMEARLKYGLSLPDWMNQDFATGDAIASHPKGKIKIILDSQHLRGINSQTHLEDYTLRLQDGMYEKLQGEESRDGNRRRTRSRGYAYS